MTRLVVIMSLYKSDILEYVRLAVDSVLSQTYADFDFYIQFDGSVSKDIDDYLSNIQDERVSIFRRDANKGLAFSLNELLDRVMPNAYQYIARMDADDISMPERFEKQIAFMDAHPEVDCLGTWAIEIKSD